MRSMYEALLAGITPTECSADLYAVLVAGGQAPSTVRALTPLIGADRMILVGSDEAAEGPLERVSEPRDRGSVPSILTGLLHLMLRDPEALVVVVHDAVALDRNQLLPGIVAGVAAVVEAPERIAVLAMPGGSGGWLLPAPIPHGGGASRGALAYRTAGGDARVPPGALADTGVLVAEARTLLRRILAGSPAWGHGLCEAILDEAMVERLYRSLPVTPLAQVLERGPEHLSVVPVTPDLSRAAPPPAPRRRLVRV